MADFAEQIEGHLDSKVFDDADPSFEPALGEARICAGRLKAWLAEMCWLVEEEHG